MKSVVILGAGYAGLAAMRRLSMVLPRSGYALTLIDASAYHCIKTRFHELAVDPGRDWLIRHPIEIVTRAAGADFVLAQIKRINFQRRSVITSNGDYHYDYLLITLGGETSYFGVRGAKRHTVSLQTYESAMECSRRVEALGLKHAASPSRRVTVCGAGIEGLEVAAMLRQVSVPGQCAITVVEKAEDVLARSQCSKSQKDYIKDYFLHRDISLRLGTEVRQVDERAVIIGSGERISSDLVIWCSGVYRTEVSGLRKKRPFLVTSSLQSAVHPEVFATGDFATVQAGGDYANFFSAQRALYQAGVLAENVLRLEQGAPMQLAEYRPQGELIALGDFDGVGVVAGIPVRGKTAALLKKANEAKYLAELFRQVPRSLLRNSLPDVLRQNR